MSDTYPFGRRYWRLNPDGSTSEALTPELDEPELIPPADVAAELLDAAGLLDRAVEQLMHHRHAAAFPSQIIELHTIEDTVARAWAAAREAHTALVALTEGTKP